MVQSVYNTYSLYLPTDLIMAVESVMLSYQNMKNLLRLIFKLWVKIRG